MGKRKWMTLIMLFAGVTFAACGNSGNSEEAVPEVMQAEDSSAVSPEEVGAEAGMGSIVDELISLREDVQAREQAAASETKQTTDETKSHELVIYYSNSRADGLETETVFVEEVTPDAIIGCLAGHNIVSIDTRVNGFESEEESGLLRLDLSKAFGEYLKTMGSSGETVIMAALTDTFLQAYEAESIRITVEGRTIETGHAVYDEPLTFTESKLTTSFSNEPDR